MVCQQKLNANRENAKKSTGPKTPRGKANSHGNALTHGLTAKRVLFRADGAPANEDLLKLWNQLRSKYQQNDVVTTLLLDTIVVECWRQGKALEIEMAAFEKFHPTWMSVYIPNLQRYRTGSQWALAKSLELLSKQSPSTLGVVTEDQADASTLEPESPSQTPNLAKPIATTTEERSSHAGSVIEDEAVTDQAA